MQRAAPARSSNVSPEARHAEPARHTTGRCRWSSRRRIRTRSISANQFVFKTIDGGEHWAQISARSDARGSGRAAEPRRRHARPTRRREQAPRRRLHDRAVADAGAAALGRHRRRATSTCTPDDGKTWNERRRRASMHAWSKVVMIEASHFDANEAYAAVERHRLEDYEPYIYRTQDMAARRGRRSRSGLPAGVYMQTVKEDPVRRGLAVLPAPSAASSSRSTTATHWQSLQLNLPPVSMRDLAGERRRSDRRHARPRVLGARRDRRRCGRSTPGSSRRRRRC